MQSYRARSPPNELWRPVCACKDSWEVMAVLELMGGLLCWEVVTVKDEKVAEASPLSLRCHNSHNVTQSIPLKGGDEIVSIQLHRILLSPLLLYNFSEIKLAKISNVCKLVWFVSKLWNKAAGKLDWNKPTWFSSSTDSFRQKKSTFSSFPVGASLPHAAREKAKTGPLWVSKGSRAPS